MPEENTSIGHEPKEKWSFDEDVTKCFDDMLQRSIPQYELMRKLVLNIGNSFINPTGIIIDLGCSRGESIGDLVKANPTSKFYGVEISKPMVKEAKNKFRYDKNVVIMNKDLRTFYPELKYVSLILSVLTLQFIPIEYRHKIIQNVYDSLKEGGAFILVEKVIGNTNTINELLVENYHTMKNDNGYSYEEINRKKLSLEGVLVPITSDWNIDLLRKIGFKEVDCFWRCLNFTGIIAIK